YVFSLSLYDSLPISIMALLIVFLTIYWQIDFSAMKKHEKKALETMDHDLKKEAQENVAPLSYAFDLMLPILTLVISTIVLFLFSGNYFNKNVSLIQATGDGDIVNS